MQISEVLLALIFILSLVFYYYVTRNYHFWKKQGVQEEAPTFPFGNVLTCILGKKNPSKFITELYQKGEGENMIGFYCLDKTYLVVRDPELIKNVLVRDFNNFSNKILNGNCKDDFRDSVLLVKNPPWKYTRNKLTSVFTSGKLKNMFKLMLEVIEDFHDHLNGLGIDGKV